MTAFSIGEPLIRVTYDFVARNSRELTVMKGDMVQVCASVLDFFSFSKTSCVILC